MKEVCLKTKNGISLFAKIILLVCICSFTCFLGGKRYETEAAVSHDCKLLEQGYAISQVDVDALVTYIETPEVIGLTPGGEPYCYYLTENVSWNSVVVAPDDLVVIICLNGYVADGEVDNSSSTGGIYFVQCDPHRCLETQTDFVFVDKTYIEAMTKAYKNEECLYVNMSVALSEDIVLDENWVLSEDSRLEVCLNGHEIIGGANLTALGGELIIHDCSLIHDCYYFGMDGMRLTQEMLDGLVAAERTNEAWGMEPSLEPYLAYITEDLYWDGTISAPDGVYIAICLNGNQLHGEIDNSVTQNGGIFVMQCGIHTCSITYETTLAISEGFLRLAEALCVANGGCLDFSGASIALSTDVAFADLDIWEASDAVVTICANGHKISNLEYLQERGVLVNVIDCSNSGPHACKELEGKTAENVTQANISTITNENGVLQGANEQTLCLLGNVKLDKTLVVPRGMSVTLCLNGFTLMSPQINMETADGCRTCIYVEDGASLTICDCSVSQTGNVTIDFENMKGGFGALFASAILNCGELTLKGGNFIAMVSLVNAGDLYIEGGNVKAFFMGIVQMSSVMGEYPASGDATLQIDGGEIHSFGIGVVADFGDVVVNDCLMVCQLAGIATGLEIDNPQGEATLHLNGGEITVGRVEYSVFKSAGIPIEEGDDLGLGSDMCVGVASNATVVIGGDVLINMEGPKLEEAEYVSNIIMTNGGSIEIAEGATIENVYEVAIKNESDNVSIDGDLVANIVPSKGNVLVIDQETGDYQLTINDGDVYSASLYSASVSLKGSLVVNFYVLAEEEFVNNPDARVIILYKGETYVYSIADAKTQGKYYVFSIEVSAKDYQKNITCNFTDGKNIWYGNSVTINKYLNYLINRETRALGVDAEKEIARRVQNYCMTASYYFDISTEYDPEDDIVGEMDQVTIELVEPYRASMTGSSSKVTFTGATLLLQSSTTIRLYFQVKAGYTIEDIKTFVDGVEVQAIKSENGKSYYVEITDISAQNLGKMFTIQIDGYNVKYCALSYAYSVLANQPDDTDLVNMVKSLCVYYKYAYEYFN